MIGNARRQHEAAGAAADATTISIPDVVPFGLRTDSFSGYTILREVHRGGQGVVFQAVQKSTQRKVAIKVMREGPFAGAGEKARFEREVQVLGQLKHPNIVTIHDTGVAGGCHYFVMDYISGQPLDVFMAGASESQRTGSSDRGSGRVAGGGLSIETTLQMFAKICDAVNAAHLRGVIHRDLKPGNIRIDQNGEPHILDFGLAKVATALSSNPYGAEGGGLALTMTGQFIGSLPWASPEQAEGMPSKIDVRTDVYSLGVILYQMLTSRFPYDVVGNMRDVLDRILRAAPVRPSTLRRQIDDEVETIVLKCLSKERERRYQTAGELARDVRHYLAGEPIEAKRDSTLYVLRKTMRRYRGVIFAAACFVTLLLAALAATSVLYLSAEEQRRAAREAQARAERAATAEMEQRKSANAEKVRADRERDVAVVARREADHARRARALAMLDRERERAALENEIVGRQLVPAAAFSGAGVEDVLNWLADELQIQVIGRWDALARVDIPPTEPVWCSFERGTMDGAMAQLFASIAPGDFRTGSRLGYRATRDAVIVSTQRDFDTPRLRWPIEFLDDQVVVDETRYDQLGSFDSRVLAQLLNQPIPELVLANSLPSAACDLVERYCNGQIEFDEPLRASTRRVSMAARNLRLRQVLQLLVQQLDGVFYALDNAIHLTSRAAACEVVSSQPLEPDCESPTAREIAARVARVYLDDSDRLNDEAWRLVRAAGGDELAYRPALRMAQAAVLLAGSEPPLGLLITLAAAQYRVGAFEVVLSTLAVIDARAPNRNGVDGFRALVFRALALHELGREAEAVDALVHLQSMIYDRGRADVSDAALLDEAEATIIWGLKPESPP